MNKFTSIENRDILNNNFINYTSRVVDIFLRSLDKSDYLYQGIAYVKLVKDQFK